MSVSIRMCDKSVAVARRCLALAPCTVVVGLLSNWPLGPEMTKFVVVWFMVGPRMIIPIPELLPCSFIGLAPTA